MKFRSIALVAAAGLSLAACGHKDEEQAPDANLTNLSVPEETSANVAVEPTPSPTPENTTAALPPAADIDVTPTQQTQDDADATGMTARVSRDEGGNESQPAH